jgi:predicted dinucleotide-binding enzyme
MRIGIVGTGHMGSALGLRWAERGHDVVFGARDRSKAERAADRAGGRARAGDLDDAAAFGDVAAKAVVGDLVTDLGLAPIDSGDLERARWVETLADFLRFQIVAMGHGFYTTLSLHPVLGGPA